MIVLACLAVLVVLGALAAVLVNGWSTSDRRNALFQTYVADEHARNMELGRHLVTMTESFGMRIADATLRESEDIRTQLEYAHADRRHLITALVACNTDPRAAQRLGLVAQADAAAQRQPARDAVMDELRGMAAGASRETEMVDSDGNAIIPVGMGG